jgi:hypothetical protein
MAWFMQQDGKAGICWSKYILPGGVWSILTCAHCWYREYNAEMLFLTVILSRAFTEDVILTSLPPDPLSVKWQNNWCGRKYSCWKWIKQSNYNHFIYEKLKILWEAAQIGSRQQPESLKWMEVASKTKDKKRDIFLQSSS